MVLLPEPWDDPDAATAETFERYLDFVRERCIEKFEGLGAAEQTRSRVPSGWTPAELLQHLRWVEYRWISWRFAGVQTAEPFGDEVDGRWQVPARLSAADLVGELRDQAATTRSVIESHLLSDVGRPGPGWGAGTPATLERVLFHLLQEYSRHLGQLDLACELAGAAVGE